jgi:hypothetical protein
LWHSSVDILLFLFSLFSLPLPATATGGFPSFEVTVTEATDANDVSTSLPTSGGGENGNEVECERVEDEEPNTSALLLVESALLLVESALLLVDSTEVSIDAGEAEDENADEIDAEEVLLLPRLRIPLTMPTAGHVQSVPPGVYCFQ